MEVLADLRAALTLFKYPLVNSMTDDEFFDIFHHSNRCFLISWILKLLDTSYDARVENHNELALGHLLYELGFCSKTESVAFMKCELGVNQQLLIIHNMLKFLKDIKNFSLEDSFDAITQADIEILKEKDLNLFPQYGDIKLLTNNGNSSSPEEGKNIESDSLKDVSILEESTQDICTIYEAIQGDLPEIKNITYNFKKTENSTKEEICLNQDSADILHRCNENVKTILQFIQDLKTVQEFERNSIKMRPPNWNGCQKLEDMINTISDSLKFSQINN